MVPDWRGGVASTSMDAVDGRNGETARTAKDDRPRPRDWTGTVSPATTATRYSRGAASAASEDAMDYDGRTTHHGEQQRRHQPPPSSQMAVHDSGGSSSQSLTRSVTNSQESVVTASTDQAATPPASDASGGQYAPVDRHDDHKPRNALAHAAADGPGSQLHHLSAIAAAQDRIESDAGGAGSRKRMADGEVKTWGVPASPVKGHSRTTSAVSMASTTGSTIGEVCAGDPHACNGTSDARLPQLSAELRTRLSYAMIKVNHGWQGRSLDEVESLASQAASPASSTSTVHRRHGSSASPRLNVNSTPQVHFSNDPVMIRRKSISPPSLLSGKPTLAPPAPIQPSMSMPAPRSNPRRNSNPRYTPAGLAQSHSGSPLTPQGTSKPISRLDQDVAETLLFMSSPGNSANLKHAFSPSGSPGAQPPPPAPRSTGRHALPSGPRRALPTQRPSLPPPKKVVFDRSGMPPPPDSPMDLDSPQHYHSPNQTTPKRRTNGAGTHVRAALSLPSGLGLGNGTARKTLRDEDIERMLDRAGAEAADSSDDEEIQLPPRRGVAGIMRA
ncbi:tubulin gamma chain [Purpureocillium lavendulum]|uniref:Tubulin gamma chain n=1 Tax=Purpureocillium lavendulum TaxID=1247861 RepID=A0AB34FN26_9HYPO|nr:tubulin gamma chain [Purpureocillium lavendulum]